LSLEPDRRRSIPAPVRRFRVRDVPSRSTRARNAEACLTREWFLKLGLRYSY
jgi:hypothetical protein